MRTANGLFVLLASAVLCGMVQISAGQSSAKDEVLAALAEQDRAFLAGDETKVGQIKSEDYLQTDVEGNRSRQTDMVQRVFRAIGTPVEVGGDAAY